MSLNPQEISAVVSAKMMKDSASQRWKDAVIAAINAGYSPTVIGRASGVTEAAIRQVYKREMAKRQRERHLKRKRLAR